MSAGAAIFIIFFILLLFNVPVAVSLGVSGIIGVMMKGIPLTLLPDIMYSATAKFTLLAIPFFIIAGVVMEKAGISKRLINFANTMVGHLPAGLAFVAVLTSCFFAAISGSGPATVAALGVILIPAMTEAKYDAGMSSGLLATAGAIGIIIPPSIAFVVYGAISGESIGELFIAGIVPGLLIGVALCVVSFFKTRKQNIVRREKASKAERLASFKDAFWGLLTPVIILGGIYGGYFTPTEAAAVAVVYGLFVGFFIYKELKLSDIKDIFVSSASSSAVVLLVVAAASIFSWVVTTENVAAYAVDFMLSITDNQYIILLIITVMLLIAGCFVDAVSAMYIFVPILLPIINAIGYDPMVFGVIMTVNLAIGQVTPPVGVNLYVACGISKISLKKISKDVLPFIGVSIAVLLLITFFPQIVQFVPSFMSAS